MTDFEIVYGLMKAIKPNLNDYDLKNLAEYAMKNGLDITEEEVELGVPYVMKLTGLTKENARKFFDKCIHPIEEV